MKITTSTISDALSRLRLYYQGDFINQKKDQEEPFRAELYSTDQMVRHAKIVAQSHKLLTGKQPDLLLKRLQDNEKSLLNVRNILIKDIQTGKTITPAAEWLLDNFFLIEEQIVLTRKHLPKGYSQGLPYLASGNSSGMPRVYDIVLEMISHSDGRVDVKSLSSFIAAYQEVATLTLGELWALPIMLRLAVIENLRRISRLIALDMIDRNLADYWADRMITTVKEAPGDLILTIAEMVQSKPVLASPFVANFSRELQGKGPSLAMPLNWMEQQLSDMGTNSNDLVWQENQNQAANQVSVRNSIGTLRFIGATDWRDFVEALSSVEKVLRQDVTGIYPLMDFATRDKYRHVVEAISKSSPLSEAAVAQKVMDLAASNINGKEVASGQPFPREAQLGYFLADKGLRKLEKAAERRYTVREKITRLAGRTSLFLYVTSISLITLGLTVGMLYLTHQFGQHDWPLWTLLVLLCLSGSAQLAISLVNWLSTLWVKPKLLPRMDFSQGIPAEYRTMVIVPTMLSSKKDIEELVEALEIRYLANREANLHFGLLTDFLDADTETKPTDEALLVLAKQRVEALNRKYTEPEENTFFLFHRPRTWNEKERKWMGYERKRGKLSALNALLRGASQHQFSLIVGNTEILSSVKYVITLDSDTQLPMESAWKLIASMAHPLNRAVYDPRKRRVTKGYGILQPRIAPAIPRGAKSLYLHMQGNLTGIDPYTRVSSDVYQDLFDEGSFIGKGIYDVDIFEQSVAGAFQDNRILSHDLLEGCYARSGLLSDVLLYEEDPSKYADDIKRHHRWIRGDWQVGAWMLPFVTNGQGRLVKNKLSALSRWKIFDNLRRSVLPLSLTLLLLLGWSVLPYPWFWTLMVTLIILLPVMAATGWQLMNKPDDLSYQAHFSAVGMSVRGILVRFIFGIAVLPYEAFKYLDAIIRTNWRMMVSGRKLLEWTPSATAARTTRSDLWSIYVSMWIAPFLSMVCIGLFLYTNMGAFLVASPMLILWFLAPALTWRLNTAEREETFVLTEAKTLFLHQLTRKTWSFFEEFITETDHWLPPDNFQERPVKSLAHRTSPTNMGLALLANLTAYDFGYITTGELLNRSNLSLQSMLQLERYQGHFYNWYDTKSLLPLSPRYVSTVDSGNLIGHLLTLRQGFLELGGKSVFNERTFEGLHTTASIAMDLAKAQHKEQLQVLSASFNRASGKKHSLSEIKTQLEEWILAVQDIIAQQDDIETGAHWWTGKLLSQLQEIQKDLIQTVPWVAALPVPERFEELVILESVPSLRKIQYVEKRYGTLVDRCLQEQVSAEERTWLESVKRLLSEANDRAIERMKLIAQLAEQCEQFSDVEYDFLFNKSINLLRIGYNVDQQQKDDGYYDLLASEVRLGVFVGIAQGKLPQESWFALGRLLSSAGKDPILLSWSGSMFEYLMPQLVMPSYENTLLYQTSKSTVKRQIDYASSHGIPWGVSESAYNMVDANLIYQYRAFGVPGLGMKRGLAEDLVIAPYASMMALMIAPGKACANLQHMEKEGFEGKYGFYEAIDYTASRMPRGEKRSIIRSYMVHHQGMGLLSLAYLLLNKPMQERFVAELRFQAALLLLQERIPKTSLFYTHTSDIMETHSVPAESHIRVINTPNTMMPEVQLLSNGHYQLVITNAGGGYSRWKDIAVTRWREDATQDHHGTFCYIKDVQSNRFWSNTYQPTLRPSSAYEAIFSQGHVEFRRLDDGIETYTEIVISPEDDTEMRRIKITNRNQSVKVLEVTSYAEVVMASQASDEAHPAFSNLFVQTEIIPEYNAILCTRRARSEEERPPWLFHQMDIHGVTGEEVSFETDRMQFIGRGNTLVHPQAMEVENLSGKQGSVLDPIVSIRYRIQLKPGQTAIVDMIHGIAETREACEGLMHKYKDKHLKNRAFKLFWTHSQVLLWQINAKEADAQLYDRLAASIVFANPALRAPADTIQYNFKGQSGLWSHSVSGDLPIVLLRIFELESMELVKQMLQAHAYWRLKGLAVDLVIWNEDYGSYRHNLQEQILGLINAETDNHQGASNLGAIFVKSADQLSSEDRVLFESVARVIIQDNDGSLLEQVDRHYVEKALPTLLAPKAVAEGKAHDIRAVEMPSDLLFFNGTGGFTPDGKEYKILTDKAVTTPAPWVNIIANPQFGTVISERGSAYTWALNAHEYRLSPWSNDPVSDGSGEAFYLRDEESSHYWSPSPFPAAGTSPYLVTHGFGYTSFEHIEQGISSKMSVFVDKDSPIKFIVLKIKNESGRERELSATGFVEMILGDIRSKTNMHVLSEHDTETGALLIRNRYNTAFSERVTFFNVEGAHFSYSADRLEFIGRNRNLTNPQAMDRKKLSGKTGAGLDPCAALQVKFDLLDGEEKEVIFQLGNGENTQDAIVMLRRFADQEEVMQSLQDVKDYWQEMLGAIHVTTPDKALNILANGWLSYQTIACRLFARSGFYQSGGAFGFRDQLQDVLALLPTQPKLAREQILLSASRQFVEGDVQHWWHPPEGRGVRTRCSDDMLWLPFVVSRYLAVTGDESIMTKSVGFLESRLLNYGEDTLYDLPVSGTLSDTLYEHCVRAIKYSLRFGQQGLPLIGAGDWNDGMDRVGNKGQGESVWLGFFLYDVLMRFVDVADKMGDALFSGTCKREALVLQSNLEMSGWDGEWYRRAYFDDGTPLGSKENKECRIDAIAQSWSVLSGAGDKERAITAMGSLNKHLVRRDLKLIQLLDPPFNGKGPNPGYIQGYVPGVRENGGQYSHAALWTLMAFAALGEREKVWELFSLINPINHSADAASTSIYKVEPYVMAADVYANESHKGRGGWTWYTGSAGWMYQFITGSLLGMELRVDELLFKPCFPLDWPSVSIVYRYGKSTYQITVFQVKDDGGFRWKMGDKQGEGNAIKLIDDGMEYAVEVYAGVS